MHNDLTLRVLFTLKVKGFPAKFNSKTQLKNVLSAFIWQVSPQHVAVGFALPEYALYIPNLPTRLYDDTRVEPGTFSILNLPNRNVSAVGNVGATLL